VSYAPPMRRRAAVLVAGFVLLTMAACGDDGGGGDEEAFCDALEELSDQVADGEMGTEDGLSDAADLAGELLADAPSDFEDEVTEVGETLEDADPDDPEDTVDTIQDELGDIAEDTCDIDGDDFAIAPEATTTTSEPDETTTTTEGGDSTTVTAAPDGEGEVNARQPIPEDFEADEDLEAAQACFDGDPAACDFLFNSTGIGTVAEEYGSTCAGRIVEGTRGRCDTHIFAPSPPSSEITDTANAEACFDGDMVACDDMFRAAEAGTEDQRYGALCGDRIEDTSDLCVDIFGEQAFPIEG
jgi:hypothetical protein